MASKSHKASAEPLAARVIPLRRKASAPIEPSALSGQLNCFSLGDVLELAVPLCSAPGSIIEFGAADGTSALHFSRLVRRGGGSIFRRNRSRRILSHRPTSVQTKIPGVTFVTGDMQSTLTPKLRLQLAPIAFAYLCMDQYRPIMAALAWLTPMLSSGSLLLFDRFTSADGAQQRAFDEWRRSRGLLFVRLGQFVREGSGEARAWRVLVQMVQEPVTHRLMAHRQNAGGTE